MHSVARVVLGGVAFMLAGACLVRRPLPDAPPPSAAHETRRRTHPDGSSASEVRLLVWSDGRVERDGPEREFHPNGRLEAERFFEHDVPARLWRSWYSDGTLRSEVDFGAPGSSQARGNRFWHANGRLAAEGLAAAGVREGLWSYFGEAGALLRSGVYRGGKRDGVWTFHDEHGSKRAEGVYSLGARIGAWTLSQERGEPHWRAPTPGELDEPQYPIPQLR